MISFYGIHEYLLLLDMIILKILKVLLKYIYILKS